MAQLRHSNLDVVEKALMTLYLPEGYGIYDFGGNNIIAPCPDSNSMEYLKDHCAAIERIRKTEEDPIRITAFSFDLQFVTAEQLQKLMLAAVEANKTQTTPSQILKVETQKSA
jgi:hypothetical protein